MFTIVGYDKKFRISGITYLTKRYHCFYYPLFFLSV